MKWTKLGHIYRPAGDVPWMQTHAATPLTESLGGDLYKIYFATRDQLGRSHTGYVVIDLTRPDNILEISQQPVLAPGALGTFDDSGAMPAWLVSDGPTDYFYYVGWNLGVTVPFRNALGLAVRTESGGFERLAEGPVLDRTLHEPHFVTSCCVLKDDDGPWRMWYTSCTSWRMRDGAAEHRYHIKYATSNDGILWERNGGVAIDYDHDDEVAITRPSVIRDDDLWRMWFCYRRWDTMYAIGYAESHDGVTWDRQDSKAGIGPATEPSWDSEMVAYPFVFDHQGERYMLYNGNEYGRTGFGLAVLERN
jgi:hypothetical protein